MGGCDSGLGVVVVCVVLSAGSLVAMVVLHSQPHPQMSRELCGHKRRAYLRRKAATLGNVGNVEPLFVPVSNECIGRVRVFVGASSPTRLL